MALPPRVYYTLQEVTARWGGNIADVSGWAAAGKFHIMTGIGLVRCGEEIVAGRVAISPMNLMPLFRRCGTGPTEGVVRRIMTGDKSQWQIITDPVGGVTVAVADMMIMADEVERFEEKCALFRRVDRGGGGTGPAAKYDWDGFYIRMIVMIHDNGLPETQSELVGQMQEWFVEKAIDGDVPDESTIRRRISPIWRALQGRA